MRIPSSLNDENLYRQRGPRATGRQPQRRLLRLLLAMVLVIAVIRQAGNPRIYELFFSASPASLDTAVDHTPSGGGAGEPGEAQPRRSDGSRRAVQASAASAAAAESESTSESLKNLPLRDEPSLNRTVAALSPATVERLIASLAQRRERGGPQPAAGELPTDLVDALHAAARASGETAPDADDWTTASHAQRLQAALDQWAVDRVDPGALWKAVDTLAFYRLLEDPASPWLRRQQASQASVISLLQQPDVYLRRRIVVPGEVVRVVHRQAAENPFGVSQYWELWLRPRDGSEQPLVLFTADVPREISQIQSDPASQDAVPVWVEGVYLKRLAYRSAAGQQLAPALVGSLHSLPATTAAAAQSPASAPPSGWLLLGISALLGVSAALLIFRQTRSEARRTRALRRSADPRPEASLAALSNNSMDPRGTDR